MIPCVILGVCYVAGDCKAEPMDPKSTIGLFSMQGRSFGVCRNTDPVAVNMCSGHCDSATMYRMKGQFTCAGRWVSLTCTGWRVSLTCTGWRVRLTCTGCRVRLTCVKSLIPLKYLSIFNARLLFYFVGISRIEAT